MDESIFLQPLPTSGEPADLTKDALTAEALRPIVEALSESIAKVIEAITPVFEEFARAVSSAIKVITERFEVIWDALLHSVATRKEWHLYKYAKRYRTRKKYKRRLTLRLMAQLGSEAHDE